MPLKRIWLVQASLLAFAATTNSLYLLISDEIVIANSNPHASSAAAPHHAQSPSSVNNLRAILRFLNVVRRRKVIVLVAVAVCGLLGFLNYKSTVPQYEASGSLLVQASMSENARGGQLASHVNKFVVGNYSDLFVSNVVLRDAFAHLDHFPPEINRSAPVEHWPGMFRALLHTSTRRGSNILEIGCRSQDPKACVSSINAVIKSALDFLEKNQKNLSLELVKSLDGERQSLESRLIKRERELIQAKQQCGDINIQEGSQAIHPLIQRAVRLNESLLEVQSQRFEQESALIAVRNTVEDGGDLSQHVKSLESILGEKFFQRAIGLTTEEGTQIAESKVRLRDEEAKLAALSQHYGPAHPIIAEITQSIQATRRYVDFMHSKVHDGIQDDRLGERLVQMIESSVANSRQHEITLQQQYDRAETEALALNDRLAEVAMAERDVVLLRNLHESLLGRIAKIDINQDGGEVRVSVINEPIVPGAPIAPSLRRFAMMSLLAGLALGLGIIYILDLLDDRFQSPEELREQLGTPVLSMVRELSPNESVGINSLTTFHAPSSVESEAFRTLRTTLAFSTGATGCLAITSSEPSDGKTTILANLGVAIAQSGKRTLMIDADMRKPGLSRLFGMRGQGGLSEILRHEENMAQMCSERIQPTGQSLLEVLPCGPKPSDASELLAGPRLEDFLGWAESNYDQVLVDCPPILAASDAAIVGRLSEGMILVVQPEKNHRRSVLRAVENLKSLSVNLLGIVVNRISSEKGDGYYGYGYGSGYGYGYGYGNGYGEEDEDEATDAENASELNLDSWRRDRMPEHSDVRQPSVYPRRAA